MPSGDEVEEYWGTGRIGRIARAFFDEPAGDTANHTTDHTSTDTACTNTGSNYHGTVETLERRSDRNRDERAVVLHNRRLPGSRDVIGHD